MPTLSFATGENGIDMTSDILFVRMSQSSVVTSSSATQAVFSAPPTDPVRTITFDGNFTAFGGNGAPNAGTVTSAVYTHPALDSAGQPTVHETDLLNINVAVSLFRAADTTPNVQALWSAITAGNDNITGSPYDDVLMGGAGDDTIDGGLGWNTAVYSGPQSSYSITINADGSITVVDQRSGSPDGTDHLTNIQTLQFSDGLDHIGPTTPGAAISLGFSTVLRETSPTSTDQSLHDQLVAQANAGQVTVSQVINQIVHAAQNTSSVATIAYEFFTGGTPSAAGMDYLVSPTGPNPNNLNSAYYQQFNEINRYINFAANLGKAGAGASWFQAHYGSGDIYAALSQAYTTLFGTVPTDAKVHTLVDAQVSFSGQTMTRGQYFALYGGDGLNGIGTKAAMVGWLMAEAVVSDLGDYALTNDAYLTAVAQGKAAFGVDMIGQYDQASFHYTGG